MEKKKNAEPITLFSNDTGDILDEGADYRCHPEARP